MPSTSAFETTTNASRAVGGKVYGQSSANRRWGIEHGDANGVAPGTDMRLEPSRGRVYVGIAVIVSPPISDVVVIQTEASRGGGPPFRPATRPRTA